MATDQYSGKYTLLPGYILQVLSADAWLKTGSGTRLAITTFSEDVKADEGEYASHELPAIQAETLPAEGGSPQGGEGYEEETIGRLEASVGFLVIVITEHAVRSERVRQALDIVARAERVLTDQFGENQMGGLDQVLPGADPGTIVTSVVGPLIEDSGQTKNTATSNRCVAAIIGRIVYDYDFDL